MVGFPAWSKGYACTALLRLYQSQFPSSCQQLLRQEHTRVPPQEKATVHRLCHNFARHCAFQVTYIQTLMAASQVCEYILVHMHRYTNACTPIYVKSAQSTSYWHSFHYCSHDWHGKWLICVKDCFRLQNSVLKKKNSWTPCIWLGNKDIKNSKNSLQWALAAWRPAFLLLWAVWLLRLIYKSVLQQWFLQSPWWGIGCLFFVPFKFIYT